jgi:cytochrome c oxidase assembly protein subunit 15
LVSAAGYNQAGTEKEGMASIAGSGPIAARDRTRDRELVRTWLHVVALLIVAMVVVGGATRLTGSGLSITEWKPVHGVIPPLNESEWQEEFARYRAIPQFVIVNPGMTLSEFQTIFWWEWAHRLLGRIIGVAVIVPLAFFWLTGRLDAPMKPRLAALFLLGGLQGAIGWWMVASGLTERVSVSQYRLTVHLTLACIILAYTVWLARSLSASWRPSSRSLRVSAGLVVALVFVQIALGGMVAGLDAGMTFNTWPLMDGQLVPGGLFVLDPWWANFGENVMTVQFVHRLGAYALFAAALAHAIMARGSNAARGAWLLLALVTAQAAVGVATLVYVVPLPLALLHQLGAVVVLWAATVHLRGMLPPLLSPATGTPSRALPPLRARASG